MNRSHLAVDPVEILNMLASTLCFDLIIGGYCPKVVLLLDFSAALTVLLERLLRSRLVVEVAGASIVGCATHKSGLCVASALLSRLVGREVHHSHRLLPNRGIGRELVPSGHRARHLVGLGVLAVDAEQLELEHRLGALRLAVVPLRFLCVRTIELCLRLMEWPRTHLENIIRIYYLIMIFKIRLNLD